MPFPLSFNIIRFLVEGPENSLIQQYCWILSQYIILVHLISLIKSCEVSVLAYPYSD